MNSPEDTIAAIATAPGEAGISIVRVSGPAALSIADRIFTCSGPAPSQRAAATFVLGRVVDNDNCPIDEALLLIMRAPHSYTGDDTVEFQGHGGSVNARRILRRALDAGARPAEPGEFTKRAFLNGRIDLLQAEAVLDLIRAKSDRAAVAAIQQLEGALSKKFNDLYDNILGIVSDIEASLDFSEEELPISLLDDIGVRLKSVHNGMMILLASWNEGHVLREGASVVISGLPNAGKSTLFNALIGRDRAIVSEVPGTTRDFIEEAVVFDGVCLKLVDTAGLRHTDCTIEEEGVRRARCAIERADIHLYVIDSSRGVTQEDIANISLLDPDRSIVVLNKSDLVAVDPLGIDRTNECVRVSSLTQHGICDLRMRINHKVLGQIATVGQQAAVISERHRELLAKATARVEGAMNLLLCSRHDASDIAAAELRTALEDLGTITGRIYHTELLDSIFSRFCIGK